MLKHTNLFKHIHQRCFLFALFSKEWCAGTKTLFACGANLTFLFRARYSLKNTVQESKNLRLRRRRIFFCCASSLLKNTLQKTKILCKRRRRKFFLSYPIWLKILSDRILKKGSLGFETKIKKLYPPPQKFQNWGGGIKHKSLRGGYNSDLTGIFFFCALENQKRVVITTTM